MLPPSPMRALAGPPSGHAPRPVMAVASTQGYTRAGRPATPPKSSAGATARSCPRARSRPRAGRRRRAPASRPRSARSARSPRSDGSARSARGGGRPRPSSSTPDRARVVLEVQPQPAGWRRRIDSSLTTWRWSDSRLPGLDDQDLADVAVGVGPDQLVAPRLLDPPGSSARSPLMRRAPAARRPPASRRWIASDGRLGVDADQRLGARRPDQQPRPVGRGRT